MNKGTASASGFSNITKTILEKTLPDRMKRLIFISSFLAHIHKCRKSDDALISKLNELLELSGDKNALVLPMQLHDKIWSDVKLDQILNNKSVRLSSFDEIASYEFLSTKLRIVSEEIVEATPAWLKYSSKTKMRSDLITLFKSLGDITQKTNSLPV
jgi:hypothetical protein